MQYFTSMLLLHCDAAFRAKFQIKHAPKQAPKNISNLSLVLLDLAIRLGSG
jgi:hypothetical protein